MPPRVAGNLPHHRELSRLWSALTNVSKQLVDPCNRRAHVSCSIRQVPVQSKRNSNNLRCLHECNIIALQKNSPCIETALSLHNSTFLLKCRWQALKRSRMQRLHAPLCIPKGFLLLRFNDTSSASSSTKFMYSSKPCMAVPSSHLSESYKVICTISVHSTHNDTAFYSQLLLLKQPDLHFLPTL